jgi:hypothetical protein
MDKEALYIAGDNGCFLTLEARYLFSMAGPGVVENESPNKEPHHTSRKLTRSISWANQELICSLGLEKFPFPFFSIIR